MPANVGLNGFQRGVGVDDDATLMFVSCPVQISGPNPVEEFQFLHLETIEFAALCCALQTCRWGQIQDIGHVGSQISLHKGFELGYDAHGESSTATLISIGGIGKPVTDDPCSVCQCRRYDLADVLGP